YVQQSRKPRWLGSRRNRPRRLGSRRTARAGTRVVPALTVQPMTTTTRGSSPRAERTAEVPARRTCAHGAGATPALMDSAGAVESKLPTAPWTTPERVAHTDHSADGHSLILIYPGGETAPNPTSL